MGAGWFSYLTADEQRIPKVPPGLFQRILQISQSYWPLYMILLVCMAITSSATIMSPLLLMNLIDYAIPNRDVARVHILGAGLLAAPLIITLSAIYSSLLRSRLSENIIFDLRCMLYKRIQRMPIRFFGETRTGELMSRLNSDVNGAQNALTDAFIGLLTNIFSFCFAFVAVSTIDWRVGVLALVIIPIFVLPAKRVARLMRSYRRQAMERMADMYSIENESLGVSGALLIKIFGQENGKAAQFESHANRVREIGVKTTVITQSFFSLLGLIGSLMIGIVYWSGGALVLSNQFTIGAVVACATLLGQIYDPLMSLTNAPIEFTHGLVSFERVFEILDMPVEIEEIATAVPLPKGSGRVVFKDVSFSYSSIPSGKVLKLTDVTRFDRFSDTAKCTGTKNDFVVSKSENDNDPNTTQHNPWALRNISFEIEAGKLVALVGPSGAGKTTLTYLIPRLYDPTQGQIYVDDMDIRDVTLTSLISKVGMVTQESYLFYNSIRANLLFARPDATEREMIEAAKAANIHNFIMGLPDRYDTLVGERGFMLSGGEKQRIALARVILKDPEIVILDEATSHLDSVSEALIQDALLRVLQGRTSFVIAHRLSTILSSDVILVLKDGEIIERGNHEELVANQKLYTSLYETQFQSPVNNSLQKVIS